MYPVAAGRPLWSTPDPFGMERPHKAVPVLADLEAMPSAPPERLEEPQIVLRRYRELDPTQMSHSSRRRRPW